MRQVTGWVASVLACSRQMQNFAVHRGRAQCSYGGGWGCLRACMGVMYLVMAHRRLSQSKTVRTGLTYALLRTVGNGVSERMCYASFPSQGALVGGRVRAHYACSTYAAAARGTADSAQNAGQVGASARAAPWRTADSVAPRVKRIARALEGMCSVAYSAARVCQVLWHAMSE